MLDVRAYGWDDGLLGVLTYIDEVLLMEAASTLEHDELMRRLADEESFLVNAVRAMRG